MYAYGWFRSDLVLTTLLFLSCCLWLVLCLRFFLKCVFAATCSLDSFVFLVLFGFFMLFLQDFDDHTQLLGLFGSILSTRYLMISFRGTGVYILASQTLFRREFTGLLLLLLLKVFIGILPNRRFRAFVHEGSR